MSFSEVKGLYISTAADIKSDSTSSSTNKIIIYAAIGAGAGVILVTIAYVITRIKRNRLRKAAVQREAARRNNYSANANANAREAPRSNRAARGNNADPRGINVNVVEQQNEWNDIYQQLYANNNNPQAQGAAYYYNNQMYHANNSQNQNRSAPQNVPAQQQQQQGHRVRVPNDS